MKGVFVDHIIPVVDPAVGWTTWDDIVDRLFCEPDNLQLLCKECHSVKSLEEIDIAKKRRAASKEELEEASFDE
jgi:5-methylcytosine-specific restriction endonuclease McrA